MYKPEPIDTSTIELPEELQNLTEFLAKNAHENWAQQRMASGWTLGPERNDMEKIHPDLIPYEELSEAEKEYDRKMAMETVKVVLSLGYRIVRDDD